MADPRSSILQFASAQLGKPYVWGATGPNGFDCSGLVYAAYKAAGVPVPREIASQLGKRGVSVSLSDAQPGDVIYYDEPGSTDHVGIFIGGGKMIDAPYTGAKVRIDNVGKPTSVRRILPASAGDVAGAILTNPVGTLGSIAGAAAEKLNPFTNWQDDVLGIVLKLGAGLCVAALVVVGARETVRSD
jgi:hypothetical protein